MQVAQRNLEIAYFNTGYYDRLISELRERLREDPTDADGAHAAGAGVPQHRRQRRRGGGAEAGAGAESPTTWGRSSSSARRRRRPGTSRPPWSGSRGRWRWTPVRAVLHFYLGELYYNRGLNDEALRS
jgi:cellulose synthase operon protein C